MVGKDNATVVESNQRRSTHLSSARPQLYGAELKLPTPQIQPDDVAEAILDAAQNPTRNKKVGAGVVLNTMAAKLVPSLADKLSAQQVATLMTGSSCRDGLFT